MKKIYIAFIVLVSMSSCKKLLDKQPLNNLTSEGYYKTQADAISGLIGAYNDFQNTQYIIHNYHCISEIAAGDSWEPNTNALGFTEFEKLQVTAANGDGKTLLRDWFGQVIKRPQFHRRNHLGRIGIAG